MSGANDNEMRVARRISVFRRGIESSAKEFGRSRHCHRDKKLSEALDGGRLERRRRMLLDLIAEASAKLKEVTSFDDSAPRASLAAK
jgi:hypothetical protein